MLLIAALASRALAQSAHRVGIAVVALDLFDDLDTRRYAHATKKIAPRADGEYGFDAEDLLRAADTLCPCEQCTGLVVGAGFEDCPDLLARLSRGRKLYGDSPETVARLKHPASFFGLLDGLGVPHPAIAFDAPDDLEGWLIKRCGGSGGGHVTTATETPVSVGSYYSGAHYYQRLTLGRSVSVLFLADGKRASVVGFNQQWKAHRASSGAQTSAATGAAATSATAHAAPYAAATYVYGGAINRVMLGQGLQSEIADRLDRLVAETGMVGLNGMDFLLTAEAGGVGGDDYSVLEINPRPPATLDLYDPDFPLFQWHLRACCGELPPKRPPVQLPVAVRAHAIVYAQNDLMIAPDTHFAPWCSDIAPPGSVIVRGAPVCTVHAEGREPNSVMRSLRAREQLVDIALWKKVA
ncbi:MAG: ATP-grasp domain-containing protein [Burkholderiales bacterium]|nr:ATP-grasp domain-containing protein [Burkholderiales bacterium]